MKKQTFKRTVSYNLKENLGDNEKSSSSRKSQFAFSNPAYEPELKEFVLEGWNGEKRRSRNYRSGWNVDEHRISLSNLEDRYGTNLKMGLPISMVSINREKYGENVIHPPAKQSELVKFLSCVLLGLNLLLWIAGVISIIAAIAQYIQDPTDTDDILGSLYSGISIIIVVLIAGCFSYYQEYQSNKIMESFKSMVPQYVTVVRDGQRSQINACELVLGDLLEFKYGDKIAADIRIIDCQCFKVDNSSITGECEPVQRSTLCTNKDPIETKNLAFFSTSVVEGSGTGIVIRVGIGTFMGRMVCLAASVDSQDTPIAKEINRIIRILTTLSLSFGVIFYGIGLSMNYTWMESLFFVIGIVLGNIPENLNVTITIILALAAKKMAKNNCLVKRLHAVETLGSASVICSDKTGTLTNNKMSVSHLWFNDKIAEADTTEFATTGGGNYNVNDPGFKELAKVATLCSRANFKLGQENVPVLTRTAEGDSSEVAILKCMEMQFGNVLRYRQKYPKFFEVPFNSFNKYQLSVHKMGSDPDSEFFLAMKGAPEKVLELCTTILIGNEEHKLDDEYKEKIKKAYLYVASFGERVLGLCDCKLSPDKYPKNYSFDEEIDSVNLLKEGLRFVGLISMIDPPRAAVPAAVLKCRSAGIKVTMITGDHPVTALSIARAVNIISEGNQTIEEMASEKGVPIEDINKDLVKAAVIIGSELTELSPEQLQCFILLHDEIVFARTSPEQKYEIVKAYQKLGHVVAVTGDGVNDSPALKRADVGIAMGSGTDVSKEVADMILLDDNFASLVQGVEEGRLIFDNLKKLIRYTMADNVAEMYSYWVFIILRLPLPMGTIAMLLSTLTIDVWPACSLAYSSAESDIMRLKPRDPTKDTLMTYQLLSYSYGQIANIETASGFFAYFVTFGCYGWLPRDLIFNQHKYESKVINDLQDSYGQEWTYDTRRNLEFQAQTAFFLAIVLCQFANAICCKTRRVSIFQKGFQNKFMNFGLVMMIVVASVFIYTPLIDTAVKFIPLNYESWIAGLPFAFLLFIYDEFRRLAVRSGGNAWISKEFLA